MTRGNIEINKILFTKNFFSYRDLFFVFNCYERLDSLSSKEDPTCEETMGLAKASVYL